MRRNRALCISLLLSTTLLACVPDPVTPTMSEDSLIPAITAERLQACATEYGQQLDGQSYGVQATVQVDQDGRVVNVALDGMPPSAPDLAACARVTLREMAVPESVLRKRPAEPPISQQQSAPARGLMGNILVLGGAIAIGEIVAKSLGGTLIFAVVVDLVHTGVKAISKVARIRKMCLENYVACVDTPMVYERGNNPNQTRCELCREICAHEEKWPSQVDLFPGRGSCEYWKRSWH